MNLPIKLLTLAGIVGASAAAAIAIDRKRHRRALHEPDVDSMSRGTDVMIIDAEILGLDPSY